MAKRGWLLFLLGLLLPPTIVLLVLNLGLWPWRGTSQPADWENRLAQRALHQAVRREAANVQCLVPVNDEVLQAGIKIYRTNCAGCHGDFGQPSVWGTGGFYPRVPQFADSPPALRSEEMFLIVRNGVRYTAMGAWKDLMSEDDTWKVVLFLSKLPSLPPDVRTTWEGRVEKK